jgi:7-cyano-7-deazaguanine synthase
MDSVTLAYDLAAQGYTLHLLGCNYGQRHSRELGFAQWHAARLGARFDVVDLTGLRPLLHGSALTDNLPVPDGHYTAPSMAVTVVPNRNAILLSVAVGVAVADKAELVATAIHAGDHFIYPDCRPEFITAFDAQARLATAGFAVPAFRVVAPYVTISKDQIVVRGAALGVPYGETWSCYKGLLHHCGTCGTCVERKEAFTLAGVPDPTVYEA